MENCDLQYELVKRKYFQMLKEAKGFSETTIDSYARVIRKFEEFRQDWNKKITPEEIIKFKEFLKAESPDKKGLSIQAYRTYLIHLRIFLLWLLNQEGFKKIIQLDTLEYLRITNKENMQLYKSKDNEYPNLEHVKTLVSSIPTITEVDRRDRAIIAFTFLTGIRDSAIISLPLKQVDLLQRIIEQDPSVGVRTKFSKCITSMVFELDSELFDDFQSWIKYLYSKGFKDDDPVFPSAKQFRKKNQLLFEVGKEVVPEFWKTTGPIRKIFKSRAETAKLKHYTPHSYRHGLVKELLQRAKSGDEIKAISQHFGHEHISTTFSHYGNYGKDELIGILSNLENKIKEDSNSLQNNDGLLETLMAKLTPQIIDAIKKEVYNG